MFKAGHKNTHLKKGLSQISGFESGKHVYCSADAEREYKILYDMAKSGIHWAVTVVKAIMGLSAGNLHQENIYRKPNGQGLYGKDEDLFIVLPGVTAIFVKSSGGRGYILNKLFISDDYAKHQSEASKPGLWRVPANPREKATFVDSGEIDKETARVVAIADMSSADLQDMQAPAVRENLMEQAATKVTVSSNGFYLHITPGPRRIGGLENVKDAHNSDQGKAIIQSATLLANTIYNARNKSEIIWASDFGGSGVLTRALEILAIEKSKDVKLTIKDNHSIMFIQPTTRTLEATKAAEALGLKHFDKVSSNTPEELRGNYLTIEDGRSAAWKGYNIFSGTMALSGSALGIIGMISTGAILITLGKVMAPIGVGLYFGGKLRSALKAKKDRHKY